MGAGRDAGSAQDAPDDGGIHVFGAREVENLGAGCMAGEDALIAGGEGKREGASSAECWSSYLPSKPRQAAFSFREPGKLASG